MKHYPTNYFAQRNRCSECGHKKEMHHKKCGVVNGYIEAGLKVDKVCRCTSLF